MDFLTSRCFLNGSGSTEAQMCSTNCGPCCAAPKFQKKNLSVRSTPRWPPVSRGDRDAGVRRQERSNSSPFRKTGGSAASWVGERPKRTSGWIGFLPQNVRPTLSLLTLWHRALANMHGWAGHVARKEGTHPGVAAILWRNAEWREIMKSTGLVLMIRPRGTTRRTGYVVSCMLCPPSLAWAGGTRHSPEENTNLSAKQCDAGEGPD